MAVAVYKTFVVGEVLTAADLNSSLTNIHDNQQLLGNPRTQSYDLDSQSLILDLDGDSSLSATSDDILDVILNSLTAFKFNGATASSVNGLTFLTSIASSPVIVRSHGTDTNIDIQLDPKGSGSVDLDGCPLILDANGDTSLRETSNDVIALKANAVDAFIFNGSVASPVNGITFRSSATNVAPTVEAQGSDTIIPVRLVPKGATGVAACVGGWAVDGATNLTWRWTGSSTSLLLQENTGTATAPTWTTRNTFTTGNGITSGVSWLASYAPSSAASVDITSIISATYNHYFVKFQLVPTTDGDNLYLRTDTSNGASFDSGASDYAYHVVKESGTTTVAGNGSAAAPQMNLNGNTSIGNATNEGISGTIDIDFLGSGSRYPLLNWRISTLDTGTLHETSVGGGTRLSAAAINAIQLLFSSGTIASGTVDVYGIAKA